VRDNESEAEMNSMAVFATGPIDLVLIGARMTLL